MSEEHGGGTPLCLFFVYMICGLDTDSVSKSMGMGALWEIVSTARGAGTADYRGVLTNNDL